MKAAFSFELNNLQTWSVVEGCPLFDDVPQLNTSPRGYRGFPTVSPCFWMK